MNLWERYKNVIRANAELFTAGEWALSNITWLLPDRFADSQLTLEAVYSLLGMVSLCHASILDEPPVGTPQASPRIPWVFWLGAVQQVEVLVELGAVAGEKRRGINKFGPLALLEAVKAVLRLLILRRCSTRILTDGGATAEALPDARVPASTPEAKARAVYSAFARFREKHCLPLIPRYPRASLDSSRPIEVAEGPSTPFTLAHASSSGRIPSFGKLGEASLQRLSQGQDSGSPRTSPLAPRDPPVSLWWDAPPMTYAAQEGAGPESEGEEPASPGSMSRVAYLQKLQAATGRAQALGMQVMTSGELLGLLRPLIYTIALRRHGRRSWQPWLISLAVDAGSAALIDGGAALHRRACRSASEDPTLHHGSLALLYSMQALRWSPTEKRELIRRRLLLLFYLLRSPFFDLYTRPPVERLHSWLQRLPLLGTLSNKSMEILFGIQDYYTYTSAS